MTPERIHILEYSGDKGKVAEGETVPPNGKPIAFGAPRGEKGLVDWREAEAFLLKQLVHHDGCRYLACIRHTRAHSERFMRLGVDAFRRSEHAAPDFNSDVELVENWVSRKAFF